MREIKEKTAIIYFFFSFIPTYVFVKEKQLYP
jgi:hypothetical protein